MRCETSIPDEPKVDGVRSRLLHLPTLVQLGSFWPDYGEPMTSQLISLGSRPTSRPTFYFEGPVVAPSDDASILDTVQPGSYAEEMLALIPSWVPEPEDVVANAALEASKMNQWNSPWGLPPNYPSSISSRPSESAEEAAPTPAEPEPFNPRALSEAVWGPVPYGTKTEESREETRAERRPPPEEREYEDDSY